MSAKNRKAENKKFVTSKKLTYATIAIISVFILIVTFFYFYSPRSVSPKAAIIDQLSSSQLSPISRYENRTFVKTAKELLDKRFHEVDYYSDNATVDQYRLLASLGYRLIIWRAHSALDPNNYVAICSSEKYVPQKYEQYSEDQLKLCNITDDPNLYFAITPKFVEECMIGKFEDTVIILMSCNGLKQGYYKTAETFVAKGVKVFLSWDGWIFSSDNDNAITFLLQQLIDENSTIGEAVHKIPSFGLSQLKYYPTTSEVSDYQIPNYKQNTVASNVVFILSTITKKHKFNFDLLGSLDILDVSKLLCISGCEALLPLE